ncbi:MAG TPA: hypothetical protein VEX37_07010 [Thermomicrobiales bacterium]|nr:hypothetical protein [Thermomicrobiales bacterium]
MSACRGMDGMRVKTITRETLARMTDQPLMTRTTPTDSIIAPEGSELASRLRSRGWVARSGWRSRSAGRPPVWLVRFEQPEAVVTRDA